MTDKQNLTDIVADMEAWAREAGDIQLSYFRGSNLHAEEKMNAFDVVTAADKASERLIIDHIRSKYPTHSILSEESGSESHEGSWRWIIDPLDGTTNFNNGLPIFSVSIALEHEGAVVAGVVFAPYLGELFRAVKGQGATLNGRAIHCGEKTELARAVLTTGMPYDKAVNPDNNLDNIARLATKVRGIRRMGSAAVDLCYVAAGFFDGYWELALNLWDVAAGALIATEAGARVESFRDNRNVSVCAASPALFPLLRAEIR
ncbi:MAG: inositol monophosphatase [Muribaculaceae bacterium]|nr:inositol monophosphatase [Muribaculaceae bacterium]